jgi:hypothetical protein
LAATESLFTTAPVCLSTLNAVIPRSPATINVPPRAARLRGASAVANGEPGTGESPPSELILKATMVRAPGSPVNRNCAGATVAMGVGVGVGVAVGVGVGVSPGVGVGVSVGDGLFETIRRGEMVPQAAIKAPKNSSTQTVIHW